MVAVAGGMGAAVAWALATICSARSSRIVGPSASLAWAMLAGLVVITPWLVAAGWPDIGAATAGWLALGGAANVGGLLLLYRALQLGEVGVVAPVVSTEGGVTALIAVAAGATLGGLQALALVAVVAGVVLTTGGGRAVARGAVARAPALWAGAAAVTFGAGLYATGRASDLVPLAWAIAPPRIVGVLVIALPLLVRAALRSSPGAVPFAVLAGCCEVLGFLSFAAGSRHGIAVAAVLASLTGAVAAALGRLVFGERLRRSQMAGIGLIVLGVATVSALAV